MYPNPSDPSTILANFPSVLVVVDVFVLLSVSWLGRLVIRVGFIYTLGSPEGVAYTSGTWVVIIKTDFRFRFLGLCA